MKNGLFVVDGDGHVTEPVEVFLSHINEHAVEEVRLMGPPEYYADLCPTDVERMQKQPFVSGLDGFLPLLNSAGRPTDDVFFGGFRYEDGPPGGFDGRARLETMDAEGIDVAVLYPSMGLVMGNFGSLSMAATMSRAYNDWLAGYCSADPGRLIGVGCIPLVDVTRAVAELEYCVGSLGFKAAFIRPNLYGNRTLDDPHFDSFWNAAQRLRVPIGLHPAGLWDLPGAARLFKFPNMLYVTCAAFPLDSIVSLTFLMYGGVLERFPELRVIILESGADWIAHWLDRLDHYWEVFPSLRPNAPLRPSEYFRRQCYVGFGCDETLLPLIVKRFGYDRVLWASDFPHFDATYPGAVAAMERTLDGVPKEAWAPIFGENARRAYNL